MATRTITALFDTYQTAADAVRRVEGAGVPHSDVSIVSNDPANRDYVSDDAHTGPAAGAWFPQQALELVKDANPPLR